MGCFATDAGRFAPDRSAGLRHCARRVPLSRGPCEGIGVGQRRRKSFAKSTAGLAQHEGSRHGRRAPPPAYHTPRNRAALDDELVRWEGIRIRIASRPLDLAFEPEGRFYN